MIVLTLSCNCTTTIILKSLYVTEKGNHHMCCQKSVHVESVRLDKGRAQPAIFLVLHHCIPPLDRPQLLCGTLQHLAERILLLPVCTTRVATCLELTESCPPTLAARAPPSAAGCVCAACAPWSCGPAPGGAAPAGSAGCGSTGRLLPAGVLTRQGGSPASVATPERWPRA